MTDHWTEEPGPNDINDGVVALPADSRILRTATAASALPWQSPRASSNEASDKPIDRRVHLDAIILRLRPLVTMPGKLIEFAALAEMLHEFTPQTEAECTSFAQLGMALEVTAERLAAIVGQLNQSLDAQLIVDQRFHRQYDGGTSCGITIEVRENPH